MDDVAAKRPRVQVPPPCDLTLGLNLLHKEPGLTRWSMTPDERFANPAGIVQGGFVAAFIDSAMGASAVTWAAERKVFAANTDLQVRFLKAAVIGRRMVCEATVVSGGRSVLFLEATVMDSEERMVARASSTYILTQR